MSEANKEKIKQWIADLRSGEYQQARMVLCKGDAFCCIGVFGVTQMGIDPKAIDLDSPADVYNPDISQSVYDAVGLLGVNRSECIEWNDSRGLNFIDIADKLERKYINNEEDQTQNQDALQDVEAF